MTHGDPRTVRGGLHPGLSEHLSWKPTTPAYFGCFGHCLWFCPFTQQHPDRLTGLQHDPPTPRMVAGADVQGNQPTSHPGRGAPLRATGTANAK